MSLENYEPNEAAILAAKKKRYESKIAQRMARKVQQ